VDQNIHLKYLKLIKPGVPQRSILGPLLVILYINDLPATSSLLHFILFADDASVSLITVHTRHYYTELNIKLLKVDDWFKANKLIHN